MNNDAALDFDAYISNTEFKRSIEEMKRSISDFTNKAGAEFKKVDNSALNLGTALKGYLTYEFFRGLTSELVNVRGQFQQFMAILTNSLGSTNDAREALQMLTDVAANTPFQLDALTGAYVKLVNQGFKPTRAEIVQLGDLSSSVGKKFDQLAEAIIDAQSGEFERLKEFGIKARQSGDQVSFTFKGVKTTVDNTSESIRQYILSLGNLDGVKGSMAAISKTLEGQISNLKDSITAMFNKMGEQSEGFLSGSISSVKFLVDNYEEIAKILGTLIITYGTYKTAVIATNVVERLSAEIKLQSALAGKSLTVWEGLHAIALRQTTAAQLGLNAAMSANVFGAVAATIALIVSGLIMFAKKSEEIITLQTRHTEIQKEYNDKLVEEKNRVDMLIATAKNDLLSKEERKKALNDLKGVMPGYIDNLTLEALQTEAGAEALKKYNQQLELKILTEATAAEKTELLKKKIEAEKNILATQNEILNPKTGANIDMLKNILPVNEQNLRNIENQIKAIDDQYSALMQKYGGAPADTQTGVSVSAIDTQIEALKKEQAQLSQNRNQWEAYQQKIEELQRRRDSITGGSKAGGDVINLPDLTDTLWEMSKSLEEFQNKVDADVQNYLQSQLDASIEVSKQEAEIAQKKIEREANVIEETETLAEKLYNIQAEYAQKRKDLENSKVENLPEHLAILKQQEDEKIAAAKDEAFKRTEIYKKLSQDIIGFGREELRQRIAMIQKALESDTLSAETRKALEAELVSAKKSLNTGVSEGFKTGAEALGQMAQMAALVDENLASIINTAAGVAGGLSKIASGDYLGGILQGATSIFMEIIQSNDRREKKEAEAKQLAYEKLEKAINGVNAAMQRQISLLNELVGPDKLAGFTDAFEAIKKSISDTLQKLSDLKITMQGVTSAGRDHDWGVANLDDYIKTFNELYAIVQNTTGRGWRYDTKGNTLLQQIDALLTANKAAQDELWAKLNSGKILADDEQTVRLLLEQLDKASQEYTRLKQDYNDYLTGTTFNSLIGTVEDMFQQGKNSAADFANTFEELMRKALLQSLKMKALEGPLQAWFEKFAAGFEGGITPSTEWVSNMQSQLQGIGENASKMWEEINKNFSEYFTTSANSSTETGLTGQIKSSITEETGSLLAGYLNNIRLNQFESLEVLRGQLLSLSKIETNTSQLFAIKEILNRISLSGSSGNPFGIVVKP